MPYNSLRSVRERKGVTIAQLAGKTSISIRTLQAYEAGERPILPDDLRKLSRVLLTSTGEILQQPSAPPTPMPMSPRPTLTTSTHPAPPSLNVPTPLPSAPPRDAPYYRPPFRPARDPRPPLTDGPPAPRPHPLRPPRQTRAPAPPGPSTAGQIEQIRHLARRMGLEEVELADRIGAPLQSLDHASARAAIARLRKEMEESGVWQPRVGEGPDHEGEYLAKLRDHRVPVEVRLIDGEKIEGIVEDFTPYLIQVRQPDSGIDVFVRKLAIAYYHTQVSIDDFE
jgi:transcriptional regulator with XRE-family HTH domain/sRNA-binding regulator protein Hfq